MPPEVLEANLNRTISEPKQCDSTQVSRWYFLGWHVVDRLSTKTFSTLFSLRHPIPLLKSDPYSLRFCEVLNGNLSVAGANLTTADLAPLSHLHTITGRLSVVATRLTNLTLPRLRHVAGLAITDNPQLRGWDVPMLALAKVPPASGTELLVHVTNNEQLCMKLAAEWSTEPAALIVFSAAACNNDCPLFVDPDDASRCVSTCPTCGRACSAMAVYTLDDITQHLKQPPCTLITGALILHGLPYTVCGS